MSEVFDGYERQYCEHSANLSRKCSSSSSVSDLEFPDLPESLIGFSSNSLDGIYKLYCAYSKQYGFCVRKGTTRNVKGNRTQQSFICNRQGKTREAVREDGKEAIKRNTKCPRTGCNAAIRAKLNEEGWYEIIHHVTDHNHETTKPKEITQEKEQLIKNMLSAGIRPRDSYDFMCNEDGEESSVGHTKKDYYDLITRPQMLAIEGGDARTMIDILTSRADEDSGFFYRVKLDEKGKLCNIFWRDSKMKEDYVLFGDVMVFDTTYRTNRYNLICAPFFGINNHWKTIMFGCAFMSDETEESFRWLFDKFKKSMFGKVPDSIFTDQDKAMKKAIAKEFSYTRHKFCTWHVQKNAFAHYGTIKSDHTFQEAFNKCLSQCETEEEFYMAWNDMVDKYELRDSKWFKSLFKNREKWCNALNKDHFSVGLLISQRSESISAAISFKANKTTSLTEFYGLFEETVEKWRSTEREDDYKSLLHVPDPGKKSHALVRHAIEVYTKEIASDFQRQFELAMCSNLKMEPQVDNMNVYRVNLEGNVHVVCHILDRDFMSCTCNRLEETKLLCSHMIRVMHMNSVERIPEEYICSRWTKEAREKLSDSSITIQCSPTKMSGSTIWRQSMLKQFNNILLRCEENVEARKVIEQTLQTIDENTSHITLKRKEATSATSDNIVLDRPCKNKR